MTDISRKPSGILFDYFNTIVKRVHFDPEVAVKALLQLANTTPDEIAIGQNARCKRSTTIAVFLRRGLYETRTRNLPSRLRALAGLADRNALCRRRRLRRVPGRRRRRYATYSGPMVSFPPNRIAADLRFAYNRPNRRSLCATRKPLTLIFIVRKRICNHPTTSH